MVVVSLTSSTDNYAISKTEGNELEHFMAVKHEIPDAMHALYLDAMREAQGYEFEKNGKLLGFLYVAPLYNFHYATSIWVDSDTPFDAALFLAYVQTLCPLLKFKPLSRDSIQFKSFCTEDSLRLFRRRKSEFVTIRQEEKYSFENLVKYLGLTWVV